MKRSTVIHRVSKYLILFAGLLALGEATASAQIPESLVDKKVLVLNSYHRGYYWSDSLISGIQEVFESDPLQIEVFIEHFDGKRYDVNMVYPAMDAVLDAKYGQQQLDAVVVCDNVAFNYVLQNRDTRFRSIPIIFCGVRLYSPEQIRQYPMMTGIIEEHLRDHIIRTALAIHPAKHKILLVNINPYNPDEFLHCQVAIKRVIAEDNLSIELQTLDLNQLSYDQLWYKLHQVSHDTVVFPTNTNFFTDKNGQILPFEMGVSRFCRSCPVPVYTFRRDWIGLGATGTSMINGFRLSEMVAQRTLDVISNRNIDEMQIGTDNPMLYLFDYEQIERFNISKARLPENLIYKNEPDTFYYRYKQRIWLTAGVIFALSASTIIMFILNIQRKQAQQLLAGERKLLQTIIDTIPDHIFVKDKKSRFVFSNQQNLQFLRTQGLSDIIGKTDFDFMLHDLASRYFYEEQAVIQGGEGIVNQERYIKDEPGSRQEWILTTKVPWYDETGNILGIVGCNRDITQYKHDQQQLADERNLLRGLVDNLPDQIYVKDTQGRFVFVNRDCARAIRAASPQDAIGKTDESFLDPQRAHSAIEEEQRIIETGKPMINVQFSYLNDDGTQIWLSETKVPWRDEEGNIIGLVGCNRNITQLKAVEAELARINQELEQRVQLRTADLEKANRELTNEIAERRKIQEQLLHYQDQLRQLTLELLLAEEKLRRNIAIEIHDHLGQNLAVSKIRINALRPAVGSEKLQKELQQISDLLSQTIESARSMTFELSPPVLYELGFEPAMQWLARQIRQQHDIDVQVTEGKPGPALNENVRVFLFQAVRELLINAVKHAGADRIEIDIKRVNHTIQVTVEDNGIGFSVDQMKTKKAKGSGFGLFSIRERLEHIGGKLYIESKPQHGTKITVEAPIGADPQ